MEFITVCKASKMDLMREFSNVTNSGKLVDDTLEFIKKNEEILDDDEYVKITQELPEVKPGVFNMMILNTKYSINVKKSTIILIMLLLDMKFANGLASAGLTFTGFSSQTIHKITERERCILLDTFIGKKRQPNDYLYFKKECVQNDIECTYRDTGYCNRSIDDIKSLLRELKAKEIIIDKEGSLRLAF